MVKRRIFCGIISLSLVLCQNPNTVISYGQEYMQESVESAESLESVTDIDEYNGNELIVVYKENAEIEQELPEGAVEEKISDTCSYVETENQEELEETIERLSEHEQVLCVEPNYKVTLFETNDTYSSYQWAYKGYASIRLEEAKALGTGENAQAVVAVVDTGIDYNHADLAANMWTNSGEINGNYIDDDGNGYIDDYYGWNFNDNNNQICKYEQAYDGTFIDYHGTHVAGIIGAVADNGIGIAGVAGALDVKLMSVKVMNNKGECGLKEILSAISYAEANGADICNLSLGMEVSSEALYNAIKNSEMLFVCAAGNEGVSTDVRPIYPACYKLNNLISVANGNSSGRLDSSSTYGSLIDIMAPGTEIASAYVDPNHTYEGEYCYATGTSMAAPFVSGTAAYLLCYYGKLSSGQLKEMILGGSRYLSEIDGKVANGAYLDVEGALKYELGQTSFTTSVSDVKNSNYKKYKIAVSNPLEEGLVLRYASGNHDLAYFQEGKGKELDVTGGTASITVKATTTYTVYMMDSKGRESLKKEKVVVRTLKKVSLPAANKTLKKGKTYQLKPTLSETGVYAAITYKSSNKSVAKVSAEGKITAVKAGTAKITVTAICGSVKKTAVCKITVKK